MPEAPMILGQQAPAATTNTDLYTVPASTSCVASTLTVVNRASTATTFRVYVRKAGAAAANVNTFVYDATINGNDTKCITIGFTLAATDVVTVYGGTANLTFHLFGVQIT